MAQRENSMTSRLALHRALRAAGLMAALAAAGCGGGGGGGDAPPPVTQVTITAANQEIVATTTANVFVGFGGSAAVIAAKDGPEALKAQAAAVPTAGALLVGSARRALLTAAPGKGDAPRALQAISSATQNCPTSGTVTATVDDADNNGMLSAGDSVTLAYAQCRDGADLLNGSLSMTFTRVVDSPAMAELSASMSFNALTASSGDVSSAMSGSVSMAMTMTSTVVTSTMTVGSGGLISAVTSATPAYSETLTMAAGLTFREVDDATLGLPGSVNPGMASMWVDGSVSSSRLGGQSISIATVTPMQAYIVNLYPHAGQIVVSGAAGTRLRMTGVDSASVRLELDSNGDGIYELTTIKPWGDIM
jgi:hypothetical protein